MTDRPGRPQARDRNPDDLAPETHNSEQADAGAQTQTVAEEARHRSTGPFGLEDSEKVPTGEVNDDEQDLVDRMKQMESSARVDLDAYRGEPNHDDNVDRYGKQAKLDDLPGDGA